MTTTTDQPTITPDQLGFERSFTGRILPTFAARPIYTWSDGGDLQVTEWAVCEGSPPAEWSRFQTVVTVYIPTPRGEYPFKDTVMIPATQPLEALRWLAANLEDLFALVGAKGMKKVQDESRRIVAPPKGHRLAGS